MAQESDLGLRPLHQLQAGPTDGGRETCTPPRPLGSSAGLESLASSTTFLSAVPPGLPTCLRRLPGDTAHLLSPLGYLLSSCPRPLPCLILNWGPSEDWDFVPVLTSPFDTSEDPDPSCIQMGAWDIPTPKVQTGHVCPWEGAEAGGPPGPGDPPPRRLSQAGLLCRLAACGCVCARL